MGLRDALRPAGELPSSVYWLRRGAIALAVVGVVVLVVAVTLIARGHHTPAARPPGATGPAPSTPTSTSPGTSPSTPTGAPTGTATSRSAPTSPAPTTSSPTALPACAAGVVPSR